MAMDEKAKRRPKRDNLTGRCYHPVVLADGQPWMVHRPGWLWRPKFERDDKGLLRCIRLDKRFGYTEWGVDGLIEAIPHADAETLASLVATIAARLLLKVYDLTESELDSLLHFKAGDPASTKWVTDVVSVVTYQESTLPPAETTEAAHG